MDFIGLLYLERLEEREREKNCRARETERGRDSYI